MGVRAQERRVLWAEERPVSGACLACLRNHKTVCDMSARKAGVGVVADEVQELVGGGGWKTDLRQWKVVLGVCCTHSANSENTPGPNRRICFNGSGLSLVKSLENIPRINPVCD